MSVCMYVYGGDRYMYLSLHLNMYLLVGTKKEGLRGNVHKSHGDGASSKEFQVGTQGNLSSFRILLLGLT